MCVRERSKSLLNLEFEQPVDDYLGCQFLYAQAPTATKHVKCLRLFRVNCYLNHPDVVVQPPIPETTKILARMVRFFNISKELFLSIRMLIPNCL